MATAATEAASPGGRQLNHRSRHERINQAVGESEIARGPLSRQEDQKQKAQLGMKWKKCAAAALGAGVASIALGGATPDGGAGHPIQGSPRVPTGSRSVDPVGSISVLREGTVIDGAAGVVREQESRFVFSQAGTGRELMLLENLALQRIARLVERANQTIPCHVTGRVTEFRGVNYLLLERTVLDSKGEESPATKPQAAEGKGT